MGYTADSVPSDKFAQVRGFKVEISAASGSKVKSSGAVQVLKQNLRPQLNSMINAMPDMIVLKTLPIPGAKIMLSSGVEALNFSIKFSQPQESFMVEDEMILNKTSEGVEIEIRRILVSKKEAGRLQILSPLELQAQEQAVITAREAGSGMATGRRSASVVCLDSDCMLGQEVLDLRQLIKKFLVGKEGVRVHAKRVISAQGQYPAILPQVSQMVEKISGVSLKIEADEVLGFGLSEETNSSLVSNPLYEGSGNSGENPLYEAKSSMMLQSIRVSPSPEQWRCEDSGRKPEPGLLCGQTSHL